MGRDEEEEGEWLSKFQRNPLCPPLSACGANVECVAHKSSLHSIFNESFHCHIVAERGVDVMIVQPIKRTPSPPVFHVFPHRGLSIVLPGDGHHTQHQQVIRLISMDGRRGESITITVI